MGFPCQLTDQSQQAGYLKQRATLSKFKRFNRHDFCLGRKNVGLLKCSNLAIFSYVKQRDYTIIPAMSAGPSLPQAPAGMIQVTNDKVSTCGESHTSSICYTMLPVPRKSFYLSMALTPGIQTANKWRNDDRCKIWLLLLLRTASGLE